MFYFRKEIKLVALWSCYCATTVGSYLFAYNSKILLNTDASVVPM